MNFKAIRLDKTYEMTVPAPSVQVFPLLCPVREYDWLPYWSCEMVFSKSGVAEQGCVFRTDFADRGKMTWCVTKYKPSSEIQYTIFKHDSHVWNLEIHLSSQDRYQTLLTWRHIFTALTEEGNAYLSRYTDEEHRSHLGRIERALVHFIETGKILNE